MCSKKGSTFVNNIAHSEKEWHRNCFASGCGNFEVHAQFGVLGNVRSEEFSKLPAHEDTNELTCYESFPAFLRSARPIG